MLISKRLRNRIYILRSAIDNMNNRTQYELIQELELIIKETKNRLEARGTPFYQN